MQEDFATAIGKIPLNTPYLHHGRDPNVGLDCVGLIFAAYKLAGLPIDHLDIPYTPRDYARRNRSRLILSRILLSFRMCGKGDGSVAWPVTVPRECRDGDVLLIGETGKENHVGIVCDGTMVQMAGRLALCNGVKQVVDGRVRVVSLHRSWAFVTTVFRYGREHQVVS